MDKTQEQPKKCFCTRCFLPVEVEDKVEIEGQNFHMLCSMCCVCRAIPTCLKMFYGHVFCNECFKTHVMTRFKENPCVQINNWCTQWGPEDKSPEHGANDGLDSHSSAEEAPKRTMCARCFKSIDNNDKVDIEGQSFHEQCAKCYFCHEVPKSNLKIYYGQVFCEECFHKHVLSRSRDNPASFFKNCFEQWQNNAQFAETMREFMAGDKDGSSPPFVFMMQGLHPSCRCGGGPQEWFQSSGSEPRKSATHALSTVEDISFENHIQISDRDFFGESVKQENVSAVEKIEKLTKFIHSGKTKLCLKYMKKWKNYKDNKSGTRPKLHGWVDLQNPELSKTELLECPKCLWQCVPIYVQ